MNVRVLSGISGEANYATQFPSNPYNFGKKVPVGCPTPVAGLFNRNKPYTQTAEFKAKRIALAVARGAFLTLVSFNVLGLGTALKKRDSQGPSGYQPLVDQWEKLGGYYDKLRDAFNAGSKRKPIFKNLGAKFGIGGIHMVPIGVTGGEVLAFIATATPIIIAIVPLIKSFIPEEQKESGSTGYTVDITPANFPSTAPADNAPEKSGVPPILLVGAAAGLAFMLFKKK